MTVQHLKKITLIEGDGVGPEVTKSVVDIIAATGLVIEWDRQIAGKKAFEAGVPTGVPQQTIESIQQTGVLLKGPLETPVGHGGKSANVTLRKIFETFANIRPAKNIPGIQTRFSSDGIDLVLIRENVEGLYTGIEHKISANASESVKFVSYIGCEKIARLAFEYAKVNNRKKVTCVTKANIMKISDGMLKEVCEEVAQEYPMISYSHILVDNCAHQLVINPTQFDVLVTTNLQGDILSDLCSGLVGGLGFAPSSNYGKSASIFEAVHGSAPDIAGKNVVNPSSLIMSSLLMLEHIHEFETASKIRQALHETFIQKIFTADVKGITTSVSTTEFTEAIIKNIKNTKHSTPKDSVPSSVDMNRIVCRKNLSTKIKEVGVDITLIWQGSPNELGNKLLSLTENTHFNLKSIANRGLEVFPLSTISFPDLIDTWQCRFVYKPNASKTHEELKDLITTLNAHYKWSKIIKLFDIGNEPGYSKNQGER
jgi:isocitrate dehydrogenase